MTSPSLPCVEAWVESALCAQTDPEIFYPEKGGSSKAAKAVCGQCEVRASCLQAALDRGEQYGVFGGLTFTERKAIGRGEIADPDEVLTRPPGRPPTPIAHGTYLGSRAHWRRGEKPCADCKRAESDYRKERALIRHAKGDPKFTCACGAFKQRASKSCASCAVAIRWSKTAPKQTRERAA